MSADPWGGGTDRDPKLRRRERGPWFNPHAVNPDRLPGEPFDPPHVKRQTPFAAAYYGIIRITYQIKYFVFQRRWTIRDWIFLAAVCVVLLQAAKYWRG